MYLVLEYMKNGDLLNVLKERQHVVQSDGVTSLPDLELWNIFRQVVAGVRYLHFQNIVHGDIKPQNLLVGEDGVVKIADFGISKMLQGEEQKLVDAAGTPAFMSPELCKGESFSGPLADVWAIGATIFMLRFGSPPFVAGNVINLYAKIQNDSLVYPALIDPGLRDLLDNMLLKDPLKRYTLRQVYTHHWLRQPPAFGKIKSNTASSHTDDAFKPPASYEKEEADAMGRPIDSVDNDELFMSIGVGSQKRVKTVQRSSGPLNEDNNGDLMKTNWGEDVFELVSDGSGSESDGDSDEEKSDTKTTPIAGRTLFKGTASNLQTLSEENTEDIMASNMSTASSGSAIIERDEMSKEEEELRANRFKHKLKKAAPPPSLDIEKSDVGTEKSPTNSVKPVNKNILTTPVTNRKGTNTSTPSSTPSLHNRKRFFSDHEDEVTNELSMEEFSQMMDTLAMQPKLRDIEESNPTLLGISINGADVNALYTNPNNGIGVAFHSEQGNRPTQEDRCILLPDVTKMRYFDGYEWESEDVATQLSKFTVGCVFDGHNGWRCSQYLCQNLAPMLIMHEQFLGKRMDQALTEVCHKLDDDICNILRQDNDMAGSTGVIAVYDGRKHVLTVANVGDSMCVLSRSGKAVKLNRMHRLDDEDEKLRVQKTGGTIVNNRVNGVLAITRAFGDVQFKGKVDEKKSSKLLNPVIATPDVYSEVITPMTEFAVIATDGLWDVYAPQAAINYVRKQLSKRYDLQAVTKGLVDEALARGSVDNVTVLIMSFHMS
jgi:serine/threonine protein kinase/serine/threonine protein phosphatase PrpC